MTPFHVVKIKRDYTQVSHVVPFEFNTIKQKFSYLVASVPVTHLNNSLPAFVASHNSLKSFANVL